MANKEYNGLQAEIVVFEEGINTTPVGYSGCEVSTVEIYIKDAQGNPMPAGQCYYEDEDDVIYNWGTFGKRIR